MYLPDIAWEMKVKIINVIDTIKYKWWRLIHPKQAKAYDQEMERWYKKLLGE